MIQILYSSSRVKIVNKKFKGHLIKKEITVGKLYLNGFKCPIEGVPHCRGKGGSSVNVNT